MACSVVRRFERCEGIGRGADQHGEAQDYHNIKYKIKIKKFYTTTQIKLTGSNYEETKPKISPQAPAVACSDLSPPSQLPCELQHIRLPPHGDSKAPGSPSPPYSHRGEQSQQNLHAHDDLAMRLQRLLDRDEDDIESSCLLQLPCKLQRTILQEHIYPDTSSGTTSFTLQYPAIEAQKCEDRNSATSPSKLWVELSCPVEHEEEMNCEPISASVQELQQTFKGREDESRAPTKAQELKLSSGEDGRGEARSPWKLQKEGKENNAVEEARDEVKKMECECCGIEEEYTGGYEERVRAKLRGHWLCGLCEAAVGEERKRMGGSIQAALEAHMQPCRRFSQRARSKASPPPSDLALPHAVGRLLCRHLSMLSPRHPSSSSCSSSPCLSRSCSLPN